MSLIWTDSFDDYDFVHLVPNRYDFTNGGVYRLVNNTDIGLANNAFGRRGTTGVYLLFGTVMARTFDVSMTSATIGLAFFPVRTFGFPLGGDLIQFALSNGRFIEGSSRIKVSFSNDNTIFIQTYNGVVISSCPYVINFFSWNYIEVTVKMSAVSDGHGGFVGQYDASGFINGVNVLPPGSIITDASTSLVPPTWNQLWLTGGLTGCVFDDLYLRDDDISYNKDMSITSYLPTGNGAFTDWGDFSLCNSPTPSQSTFIQSTDVVDNKSYYTYPTLAVSGNIIAVCSQAFNSCVLDAGGSTSDQFVLTEYNGAGPGIFSSTINSYLPWIYDAFGYDTDPQGNPWTNTTFNNTQFGLQWKSEV